MQKVSVLLQEQDDEFRNEIATQLSLGSDFTLQKSYKYFEHFSQNIFEQLPDVVIFNWQYPQKTCFDFVSKVLAVYPRICMITTFDFVQPDFVFHLQELGVELCLLKPFKADELLKGNRQFIINSKITFHLSQIKLQNKGVYV